MRLHDFPQAPEQDEAGEFVALGIPPGPPYEELAAALLAESSIDLIVETDSRDDSLPERVREALGHDIVVRRMFSAPEATEHPETPLLDNFWQVRLNDVGLAGNHRAVFDLARSLRSLLGLRSVEVDIPVASGPTTTTTVSVASTDDRAWALRKIKAPKAWAVLEPNPAVRIGHPDTGYFDHDDLDGQRLNVAIGYNFVSYSFDARDPLRDGNFGTGSPGHGLSTGSVIMSGGGVAAVALGQIGGTTPPGMITGVARTSELVPIRTSDYVWWVKSSPIADAIEWAHRHGCKVISISMGGLSLRALEAALNTVTAQQTIVVAAAGNIMFGFLNLKVLFPAGYDNCIAAAATDIYSYPWSETYTGSYVDISAPGHDVWCAVPDRQSNDRTLVQKCSGTSFATAHVAGAASLWLQHNDYPVIAAFASQHGVTLADLLRCSLRASADVPDDWNGQLMGAGILDAYELLDTDFRNCLPYDADTRLTPYTEIVAQMVEPTPFSVTQAALARLFEVTDAEIVESFEEWGQEFVYCLYRSEQFGFVKLADISAPQMDPNSLYAALRDVAFRFGSTSLRARVG